MGLEPSPQFIVIIDPSAEDVHRIVKHDLIIIG